jgi:hypothetical protein
MVGVHALRMLLHQLNELGGSFALFTTRTRHEHASALWNI